MPVIDASVFVAVVNHADRHHAPCRTWFEEALSQGNRPIAPSILVSETAAAISRGVNDAALALAVTAALAESTIVELVPITAALATTAADIAATYRIRGCDAIYVALAASVDEPLVTLDRQQGARASELIKIYSP
ncbi:MAG: PIN domain-containing protein [Caldilineaceae bacterium]|nr:PIN domain-containing protein [Caldilineaceae bacterium]